MNTAAPHGFRANASGLLVPEEVSRERQVMSWQEWRDLEKVTKMLEKRGKVLQIGCRHQRCQRTPIQRVRTPDGNIALRCEHEDLIFSKAVR